VAAEHERRLADYEGQVAQLQETIKGLGEEVVVLRRRLQDAPKRVRTLEEKILAMHADKRALVAGLLTRGQTGSSLRSAILIGGAAGLAIAVWRELSIVWLVRAKTQTTARDLWR